jgi:hypothetical protein
MSVDLTSYTGVRTSLFVRIDVAEYSTTEGGPYANEILRFTDHNTTYSINSESYIPVGDLLTVTNSVNELRPTGNTASIALSGIPNANISEIVNSKIKGSTVQIYRGYFDISTGAIIGDVQNRYIGMINNYSLEEEYDVLEKTATNTIQLECLSNIDVLSKKIAGRRTNPESMKKFYSSDVSFDNITALKNRSFDFGVTK